MVTDNKGHFRLRAVNGFLAVGGYAEYQFGPEDKARVIAFQLGSTVNEDDLPTAAIFRYIVEHQADHNTVYTTVDVVVIDGVIEVDMGDLEIEELPDGIDIAQLVGSSNSVVH